MVVSHGNKDESRPSFPGPRFQILPGEGFHHGFIDHGHHPLMVVALAYPLQLFVIAELVGFFPIRQGSAQPGKLFKPVRPEEKPLDPFGMMLPQGGHGVQTADRQFIG
jgi:hypothetical protein